MSDGRFGVSSEMLLLYELSLAVGSSLDLTETCKAFVDVLMARKDLAYTAVWIASSKMRSEPEKAGYELVYAVPEQRVTARHLGPEHASFQRSAGEAYRTLPADDPGFEAVGAENGIEGGAYALFNLGDIGVLKLYTRRDRGFSARELKQLCSVVEKFAISLRGALAHQSVVLEHSRREVAQRSLQRQTALLRSLIDSVPDLIFYKDKNSVYLGCNRAFEGYANRSEEEIVGRTDLDFFDRETAEFFQRKDAEMLASGVARRNEEWIEYPDGRKALLDTLKTPFSGPDGETLGLIGISRDITESRRAEQALRRVQKMDAIGQLTGGIAHDFNNILGIILGNLGLLRRQIEDHKVLTRVEAITKTAQRAADLTRQLLGFSRRQAVQVVVTDINQVIAGMDSLIVRSLTPEVMVQYELSEGLWCTEIDPGDFQDALLNLVINARDAMPGGGSLSFVSRNVVVDADYCARNPVLAPGEYVQLEVNDTGQGIPPEQREHILEPFFSTKSQGQGTGLGLAMVYGFIERSKGQITVDSWPGAGTSFRLLLPRTREQEQRVETVCEPDTEQYRGSETILVVDDETALLEATQTAMEALGYRVLTATDGRQALAHLAEEQDIALLFSDIVMPGGMNGYELAEKAAARSPGLKVLLTSGYTQKAATNNEYAGYASSLLGKPYTVIELARWVRILLGTKRGRGEV